MTAQAGAGAPPALRRDVRLLGRLLGEVLAEQSGPELFTEVEAIRRSCKRLRAGWRPEEAAALRRRLAAKD